MLKTTTANVSAIVTLNEPENRMRLDVHNLIVKSWSMKVDELVATLRANEKELARLKN